jgi:hypothetical protein
MHHLQATIPNLWFRVVQVTELGVDVQFGDDAGDEDWDDMLEETEDPWMRAPAGISGSMPGCIFAQVHVRDYNLLPSHVVCTLPWLQD